MRMLSIVLLIVLGFGVLPGHAGELKPKVKPKTIDTQAAAAMAKANNAFARKLYGELRAQPGNLFLSPYSVHATLLMTREAATGQTAKEIDALIGTGSLDRGAGYMALRETMLRSRYQLRVANALWAQKRYWISYDFLLPLRDTYRAPLRRVDFQRPEAARVAMNRWVAQQTQNKIRDLVPPGGIPDQTRLALMNAVYFKGAWQEEFYKPNTKPAVFHAADGTKPKVPLMRQMEGFDYAEIPGVQILRLPYQLDEASMVIFLPRDAKGLAAIEQKFCEGTLGDWQKSLDASSVRVDVSFPRFRFSSGFDLERSLVALGLECAFDPLRAEFGTIRAEEPIFLGAAYHKGFVAVDEKGTEAAAATKFGVAGEAMPTEPISFRADRPFFFLIQDGDTKAILFMGRFAQP